MKQFIKIVCVGGYYRYCFYKITDFVGQVYYLAEPCGKGVTRYSETVDGLKAILESDAKALNQFHIKVR